MNDITIAFARYITALVLVAALFGCTQPVEPAAGLLEDAPATAAPCGPDDGLVLEDGAVVHGISQCALCARFQSAYEARAAQLGCDAPFPASACVDEGLTDCLVEQVDEWADFTWATSCEQLHSYAARPETYDGFVCGDSCVTTGTGIEECCPGTPYALRAYDRCPYWCDGLSQCGGDAECEALLAERGPRR